MSSEPRISSWATLIRAAKKRGTPPALVAIPPLLKFSCVTIFLLFRPTVLLADAGLPMIAVTFPGMILLLLPVIAIEAVVLRLRLSLPLQRALKVSGVANVVSMLAGIPATWFVLTLCEMGFMAAADALTNPARSQDSAMERIVAVIVTAPWLPPPEGGLWRVPLAILILLVPFFLVSVWVEGLVAKRMLRDVSNDLESRSWRKGSQSASDTLNLGDAAPKFRLNAANRPETSDLQDLLQRGPLIVEFLRGTW